MRGSTPLGRCWPSRLMPITLAMRPAYLHFGTALKGAFPHYRGTDHLQPMMILSEELAMCTYPFLRF